MKAIGIIAEYNPFHNGHLYHINKIKEKYPNHKLILIMAGNFTERGGVMLLDKWKRTEIALKHGIDLVIELPYPFATQSADYFAYGSITILEKLHVEKVIFGSESDDLETLELIATTQINNPEFDKLVKIYSKLGNNYPTAISKAIYDLTEKTIKTPNDLLGVSYLKVIISNNYKIKAETVKRINNYHDKNITGEISSATAIREALKDGKDISNSVPKDTLKYYTNLHYIDDYFEILKYKIITTEDLTIYQTVDSGLSKALKREILKSNNTEELIKNVKSKFYTYNKISRMLIHILCNFTKEKAKNFNNITYIRVLGLNNSGRLYLNEIKKELETPLISKITKSKDAMLEFELETTNVYAIKDSNLYNKEQEKIIYMKGEENDKK